MTITPLIGQSLIVVGQAYNHYQISNNPFNSAASWLHHG